RGLARVDLDRCLGQGVPEAVFCQGKTPAQVLAVVTRLAKAHDNILATRADTAVIAALEGSGLPLRVHAEARLVVVKPKAQEGVGLIAVGSAGASDVPAADEAAGTAEA